MSIAHFGKIIFYTWVNISFDFRARKSYYIPNYCKLYEESAELDHFALATVDSELQPRKPVHFSMSQTLARTGKSLVVEILFMSPFLWHGKK